MYPTINKVSKKKKKAPCAVSQDDADRRYDTKAIKQHIFSVSVHHVFFIAHGWYSSQARVSLKLPARATFFASTKNLA